MGKRIAYPLLIIIFAALLFVPGLGKVHLFDWDEINFAESAREMIVTGDYTTVRINYLPFWEKPPLFIWMQVFSMKVFGVNEMAARLPNAVCGIFTLLLIYSIGRRIYNEKFGLIWSLAYAGSILPFFYFKSGIIDPWFNFFIFLSIYYLIRFVHRTSSAEGWKFILLAAVASGLGILTKGPVALLLFALTGAVYLIFNKFRFPIKWYHVAGFILTLCLVGGFWFILLAIQGNAHTIANFFEYQVRLFNTKDAGHGGFLLYHFVILFIGVFPASILALLSGKKVTSESLLQRDFCLWMKILFWVVLILFTIVKTKIVHYSSMCYFPLTFLAAWVVFQVIERRITLKEYISILLIIMSVLLSIVVFAISRIEVVKNYIIDQGWIADPFAQGNLQAVVPWNGWEWLPSLFLPLGVVLCIYLVRQKHQPLGFASLFGSVILFSFFTMHTLVPRIENYSQRTLIDFLKSVKGKNCYVQTAGFKSYAKLFYFEKPQDSNPNATESKWLETGDVDKPVYLVYKITKKEEFAKKHPDWKYIYERNGFVFSIRFPKNVKE
jgi:4-amino-4-deoxy-L-arabinose transferase-like glycosyltransferase